MISLARERMVDLWLMAPTIRASHKAAPTILERETFRSCREGMLPTRKTNAATLKLIPGWPWSHHAIGRLIKAGAIDTGKAFHQSIPEQDTDPSTQESPCFLGHRENPFGVAESSRAMTR